MTNRKTKSVLLWILQGLLSAVFLFAGGMKWVLPAEVLKGSLALPVGFFRFIGVAEVLGALGLILPGLLRIRPSLTPLAALGLVAIMIGATLVTIAEGPVATALIPLAVGVLAAVVAYARWEELRAASLIQNARW
jgi:hypothetical protein